MTVMSDVELVRRFIDRLSEHDAEGAVTFMTDDVFVHNMPIAPTHSKEEWKQAMLAFGNMGELKIELLNIVGDGNGTVLTERLDKFLRFGTWIDLPVMGAFTILGGKIVSWREYFDMSTYVNALEKASTGAKPD